MKIHRGQSGRTLFLFILLFVCAGIAYAASVEDMIEANNQTTRIEVNAKTDEITFIIKGEPKAVIDQDGLKIFGDTQSQTFLYGSKQIETSVDKAAQ